jgi:hypothetical protein
MHNKECLNELDILDTPIRKPGGFIHRRRSEGAAPPWRVVFALGGVITIVGGMSACNAPASGYGSPTAGAAATQTGGPTLTVLNFLNWCSVTIAGGAPSTNASITASVTPGSDVTIVATPASASFQIGPNPWLGVDPNSETASEGTDVGSGTNETSTVSVAINGSGKDQCVSVCCQEPGNSPTPCPVTNPCPATASSPPPPSMGFPPGY